jgi:hypothetical protein
MPTLYSIESAFIHSRIQHLSFRFIFLRYVLWISKDKVYFHYDVLSRARSAQILEERDTLEAILMMFFWDHAECDHYCRDVLSTQWFSCSNKSSKTRTNTGLSSPAVRMMINYQNIEGMVDIFCCGINAIKRCYFNPLIRDLQ